jgi:peptidoglycan/LPS O-acetylase OafA/YrhL
MKKIVSTLLIFVLIVNICFGDVVFKTRKISHRQKVLSSLISGGFVLNQSVTAFDQNSEPPSWCVTAVCIGLGLMGVIYVIGGASDLMNELEGMPPEACLGCLTGIVLGALFAYLVPLSSLTIF